MSDEDLTLTQMQVDSYEDFRENFTQTNYYVLKSRGQHFGVTVDFTLQIRANSEFVDLINAIDEDGVFELTISRRVDT